MTASPRRAFGLLLTTTAIALFATLAATGGAAAATVTQQTTKACATDRAGTDWVKSLALPKFNPALGTLTSVQVTQNASINSSLKVESKNGAARTDTFDLVTASAWIEAPGTNRLTSSLPTQQKSHQFTSYDGVTDYAGGSGWSTSFGDDSQQSIEAAAGLAAWTGTGSVSIPAAAYATTTTSMSGNYVADWSTEAGVSACVVYTYTEEVLVCIGDYVWIDADKDGVQDPGEASVPGRPITVTDANGATLGTTTTDATGRWMVCGLEPSTPCVIAVDLPDGYTLTPSGVGDDTLDSDGAAAGSDATIRCATPARDRDLSFDVGINQTPTSVDQPVAAQGPAPAVLRIGKRSTAALIRSGGTATFLVTVRNRGTVAVGDITVCDTPPRLLAFSSRPAGSFFRAGKLCWKVNTLGAGESRTFKYTMRASSVARRSCVTNSVTAAAAVGGSATARAGLCIRPTVIRSLPLAG